MLLPFQEGGGGGQSAVDFLQSKWGAEAGSNIITLERF